MSLKNIILFSFTAIVLISCNTNEDKVNINVKLDSINISSNLKNNKISDSEIASKNIYTIKSSTSKKIVFKKSIRTKKFMTTLKNILVDSLTNRITNYIEGENNHDSISTFENFERISFKTNEEINSDSILLAQIHIPNYNYGLKINNLLPPFYIYNIDSTKQFIYKNPKKFTLLILTDTSTCIFCNPYIESIRTKYFIKKLDTVLSVYNISLNKVPDTFMFNNLENQNRWLYGWYNQYLPAEFDFKKSFNIENFPITLLMDGEMRIINVNPNIDDLINLIKIQD